MLILALLAELAYVNAQVVDTAGGFVVINRGVEWGFKAGLRVAFYNYQKIYGIGRVVEADSWQAKVRPLRCEPQLGHLARAKVELPGQGWNEDPLLTLGRLYIAFTDDSGHYFFDPDWVIDTPKGWRLRMLEKMVKAARALAPYVKDIKTDAGEPLDSLLRATDTSSVMRFLEFAADFPAPYMGRSLPFAAAYATWLKRGAPPSGKEVARRLAGADELQMGVILEQFDLPTLEVACDWLWRWGKLDLLKKIKTLTKNDSLKKFIEKALRKSPEP